MKTVLLFSLLALVCGRLAAARPEVIPELRQWTDAAVPGVYAPTAASAVVTEGNDAALAAHAGIFAAEAGLPVRTGRARPGDIVLGLLKTPDGELGGEGYVLEATPEALTLRANTPLGVYWGTRTVLQVLRAQNGTFPCGTARDWPAYAVRGFMFDVGRKAFTLTTLRQVVELMSYYKMNDLQLHLSDNCIWLHAFPGVKTPEDVLKTEPAAGAFRLESDIEGLTAENLSYSKQDYRALVAFAAARGVDIVPEIDVPGHALPLVRVRPDLMYRGPIDAGKNPLERAAMLDLDHPGTLPFVQSLFGEYIDGGVFSGKVVHIGTDEYYGANESFRKFSDAMLRYLLKKGKTPRLWGSLTHKPGRTPVVAEGVQMHIWDLDWQNPVEAAKAGYDLINIVGWHTYSVPSGKGDRGGFKDDIDAPWVYANWKPDAFPRVRAGAIPAGKVIGGAWAIWNDWSFILDPGLCGRDLLPRIRTNCAVIAQKTWAVRNSRDYKGFTQVLEAVGSPVDTAVPVWEHTWTVTRGPDVKELILADGDETTVYAVSPVNGKVGFRREADQYTFDYTLPEGRPVKLTLKASERKTELFADGKPVGGTPVRRFWPEKCVFFTLPKPESL